MFERFTTEARETVKRAQQEARGLGHDYIGTEHLLLAMLDPGAGTSYQVLHASGVDRQQVVDGVTRLMSQGALGEQDAAALRAIGIDLDAVREQVEGSFGEGSLQPAKPERRGWLRRGRKAAAPGFTLRARNVIVLSLREAIGRGDRVISTRHLLLGLLREDNGLAAQILTDSGLSLESLRTQTLSAQ